MFPLPGYILWAGIQASVLSIKYPALSTALGGSSCFIHCLVNKWLFLQAARGRESGDRAGFPTPGLSHHTKAGERNQEPARQNKKLGSIRHKRLSLVCKWLRPSPGEHHSKWLFLKCLGRGRRTYWIHSIWKISSSDDQSIIGKKVSKC